MENTEIKPLSTDRKAENPLAVSPQIEKNSAIQGVINFKKENDLKIGSEGAKVEGIFGFFKRSTSEENKDIKVSEKPEEILEEIGNDLTKLSEIRMIRKPTIDDIADNLAAPALKAREIEEWLSVNENKIQSESSNKEVLEKKREEILHQLDERRQKSILQRVKSLGKKHLLDNELRQVNKQILTVMNTIYADNIFRRKTESEFKRPKELMEKYAIDAAGQFFENVVEQQKQLRDKLNSPEIIGELNNDLIAQKVLPKLDEIRSNSINTGYVVTNEEAKEYVDLIKIKLAKGNPIRSGQISEKDVKETESREKRLRELNIKSGHKLQDIDRSISVNDIDVDIFYEKVLDILLRQLTKGKIESVRDLFGDRLDEKLQGTLKSIAEDVIDNSSDWGERYLGTSLDLNKLKIDYFKELYGLERWPIVKKFAEFTGIIPKEIFESTEKIIIQRLFDEQLFSGGESDTGTEAAKKMGDLGNSYALPLMLRYLQAFGTGNTSMAVLSQMRRLINESDPEALKNFPENKGLIMKIIADKNSCLNRFSGGEYEVRQAIRKYGDRIIRHEKYTKALESTGMREDELNDFYNMTSEYDEKTKEWSITKLLRQIEKAAEITGDNKKNILDDYFDDLTSKIFISRKETPNIIKQLSQEMGIPPIEIYDRVKDKFNLENLSNYPEELWNPLDSIKMLKELAFVIGVEKKDLIGQYFDRITSTISLQKKYSANTIEQLSIELDQPAKEIYERVEENFLKSKDQIFGEAQIKSLELVREIATVINVDKKILIEKYFKQLTQGISISNKYSPEVIKQLADDLNQPAKNIYDRVKQNLDLKSHNPLRDLEILKQIATVIDVDKKDFITQYLDQLTAHIDYQQEQSYDIILKIGEDIANSPEKTAQDIANEIAKKDFINSLKGLDLKRSGEIRERFDFFISSQELLDINPRVHKLLLEFKNISPEFYEQALKSPDIVISLFSIKDHKKAIETVNNNLFLIKAVAENPRYGSKLLVKYPEFDEVSRKNIKSLFDWKKEILENNPQIDPQSVEFRKLMQERLKGYKNNSKILYLMKQRGIDIDKWLNYDKIEHFTLSSAESRASFSEVIATPINRIKETISMYADQVKNSLKDFEPELKEHKIPETRTAEIVELMRKMEEELQKAQSSGDVKKAEGIQTGIAQYKEKMKKIKEISLWDKVNGDINAFARVRNSVSESHEKVITAEKKYEELLEKKDREPKHMEEAKRNINKTKEDLKEKFRQLEKRMSDFGTNLPEILEPIGNEKSEELRRKMQENLAEQFDHYDSDISDLNNLFSQETDKEKERLEGRPMMIMVWSRDPDIDTYQGNYSSCCISVETGTHNQPQKSAIADYETDLGIQVVVILDEYTKEPVTAAWCWTGEDGEMKTSMVADNIESNTKYSNNFSDQMTDKLFGYIKEYSDAIKAGKAVMGKANNDLPTKNRLDKMTNDSKTYSRIGGYNREEGYFLEAEDEELKVI